MKSNSNHQVRKILSGLLLVGMVLSLCFGANALPAVRALEGGPQPINGVDLATFHPGGWLDQINISEIASPNDAVTQLQDGTLDIYTTSSSDPTLFATVKADPNLAYTPSFGSYNEMTFNPAVFTDTTRLNPYSNPKIREAMNYIIDRTYVAQEIFGGLAVPKFTMLNSSFADYTRFLDVSLAIEAKYALDMVKADQIITDELTIMGAEKDVDGIWTYSGAPINLIMLIRTEDKRKEIGDYMATQLETLGFTVDRQYKTRSEASPIWVGGNPTDGLFHIYTGGWVTNAISRDQGADFSFFYTKNDYPIPLFQAYTNTPVFEAFALALRDNNFTSMEERATMFREALPMSLESSQRIWVVDQISFAPMRSNIQVIPDLVGGVSGSSLWPYTLRFEGIEGGKLEWAQSDVLVDPWNPIGGSNWVYDMSLINATSDNGVLSNPETGLNQAQRIQSAVITAQTGLPIAKTSDWVTLSFSPSISVPEDAWSDWDAHTQKFISAGTRYPGGTTSLIKSSVTYPVDLFTTVVWHDGSPLSMADFVMRMIMTFDLGKPHSDIYDASQSWNLDAFMSYFKGVKIISTDPLVIETYQDNYYLDAEDNVVTWWPQYDYGPGAWHVLTVSNLAEAAETLAYGLDKATTLGVPWMSFIGGPSLPILKSYLDQAIAAVTIPYAPTLGAYITSADAAGRYAALQSWYTERVHFWVGTGPYYLDSPNLIEKTLVLKNTSALNSITDPRILSTVPYQDLTDTSAATQVIDDPDLIACDRAAGLASVWYKFSPTITRELSLDTYGSDYDTMIGVWSGAPGSLTPVACNDDSGGGSQSFVTFAGTGGTDYYIGISQYNGPISAALSQSAVNDKLVPEVSAQSGGNLAFHVTTFADAPGNAWYWKYVEGFYAQGITTGCALGPFRYCPERAVTRAEMAVFILRAQNGASYIPDPAETGMFADVPVVGKEWMQPWIEQFYASGMTTGCAASPLRYCPEREVTRAEMAVFVLRAVHGASYVPPAASGVFSDLPVAGKEWMQPWIEQFYVEGITTGCASAPLRYCPEQSVTRAEMATFIDRAFAIPTLPLP